MNPSCPSLKQDYESLLVLKDRFQSELKNAAISGDFSALDTLKAEIEATKTRLEEQLGKVSLEKAKELFKENFLCPEAIEQTFDFAIDHKDIPKIPFSKERLEEAQKEGFQLVLSWDTFPDGTPMTGKSMADKLGGKTSDGGKILVGDWSHETFFTDEIPERTWRLVKTEETHAEENYLQQTDSLAKEIEVEFSGKPMPKIYEDALAEYEAKKATIETLWRGPHRNQPQIVEILANLQITKLTRESFSELLQRLVVTERKTGTKLLSDGFAWTRSRHSAAELVYIGCFSVVGVPIGSVDPWHRTEGRGVCSSRRA